MADITALFWDVGGVLLTNGWDKPARRRAIDHFALDAHDFECRHHEIVSAFETRQVTLHEYLQATVFYRPREFTPTDFRKLMAAQSQACRRALQVVDELAAKRRYLLGTINNESLELNLYRIRKFELRRFFSVFCSSCFVGARKPGREIYLAALELTQRAPEECLFIDDRPENLEAPSRMGMRTIEYRAPQQLREELSSHGIGIEL